MRLVMIGPPASGKGTQARGLAKTLGLRYLSTGALLREHMAKGTPIGEMARPILDRGGYLPDSCMCEMVGEWLEGAGSRWILDGFPRSLTQGEFLQQWLESRSEQLDAAVYLEADLEDLKQRIEDRVECPACRWSGGGVELSDGRCPDCGALPETRQDDTVENFLSRHQAYIVSASPMVDHYRTRNALCACDATKPRDEVTAQLLAALQP